ncbi:MAG: DOMON-like domain-containing protein [Pseudomonadota bacterium]
MSIRLTPHPAHPCDESLQLVFEIEREAAGLTMRFTLTGELSNLRIPGGPGGARRDELWTQTCFELFAQLPGQSDYWEYNFSPNGDWAMYRFSEYRKKGSSPTEAAPIIQLVPAPDQLQLIAQIPALPDGLSSGRLAIGPAAILQPRDGKQSYWAVHHSLDIPDFHRAESFKIRLD